MKIYSQLTSRLGDFKVDLICHSDGKENITEQRRRRIVHNETIVGPLCSFDFPIG